MGVIDYLNRLVNQVTQAVSLALSIVSTLITSGWYIVIRDAATVTGDIHGLLDDPTCGQEAQCTKLDTIITTADDIVTLLNDLSTLVGGARVVNLPATPPAGYGGASSSSIAAAVWTAVSDDESTEYGTIVAALSTYLRVFAASGAMPGRISERATFNFDPFALIDNAFVSFVEITPASILATHTSTLDWLNDVYSTETWHDTGYGTYWANVSSPPGNALVTIEMTPSEFAWYRANANGLILPSPVPPVWPGLANVTYGAPQSMDAPNGSLSGPADGYKILIDAQPSWAGKFDFGSVQAWRNVGAIAFLDDETIPEPAQTLGFASVIYTPQRMAHSSGALYRIATGYHATATPYVINS